MAKKILVIDYDQKNTSRLSAFLSSHGFEVITANDGQTGWDLYKQAGPDLVLLEPMLSKIHGFELCQKIKSASLGRTPVIITTAIYKDIIYKTEALKTYGAFQYYEKPVDDDKLLSEITRALKIEEPDEVKDTLSEKSSWPGILTSEKPRGPVTSATMPRIAGFKPKPQTSAADNHEKDLEELLKQTLASKTSPLKKQGQTKAGGQENPEIDELLKKALKDFNFVSGNNRPAEKEGKQAPLTEPARKVIPPPPIARAPLKEPAQGFKPPVIEKAPVAAAKPATPAHGPVHQTSEKPAVSPAGRTEQRQSKSDAVNTAYYHPFDGLYEEPVKKKFRPLAAAAIGVVLLGVAAFLIFKPESSSSKDLIPEGQSLMAATSPIDDTLNPVQTSDPGAKAQSVEENDDQRLITPKASPAVRKKPAREEELQLQPVMQPQPGAQQLEMPTSVPAKEEDQKKSEKIQLQNQDENSKSQVVETSTQAVESQTETEKTLEQVVSPPIKDKAENETATTQTPTAPAILPGQLVALVEVDQQPTVTKRVAPVYPEIARKFRVEGSITVNALVNEFGNVIDTGIIKGIKDDRGLHQAAEQAVRKWKFRPGYLKGIPVKVWIPVVIKFKADEP